METVDNNPLEAVPEQNVQDDTFKVSDTLKANEDVNADTPQNDAPAPETSKEANFRAMRESNDRLKRERDEAYQLLQRVDQAYKSKEQPQKSDPLPEKDFTIAADDLVEGKHINEMAQRVKQLELQVKNYQQESTAANTESRLKAQYPDFDSVVNQKNLDDLRIAYPDIAKTIHSSSDLYSKAVSAYTLIKKLGIEKKDVYEKDRLIAQENHAKPRPLSSISPQQGDSPLSHVNAFAHGLTDELKKRLHRETVEAMKN